MEFVHTLIAQSSAEIHRQACLVALFLPHGQPTANCLGNVPRENVMYVDILSASCDQSVLGGDISKDAKTMEISTMEVSYTT